MKLIILLKFEILEIPSSTYYDKYGPSGSWTKAARGTMNIAKYFTAESTDINNEIPIQYIDEQDKHIEDEDEMIEKIFFLREHLLNSQHITNA